MERAQLSNSDPTSAVELNELNGLSNRLLLGEIFEAKQPSVDGQEVESDEPSVGEQELKVIERMVASYNQKTQKELYIKIYGFGLARLAVQLANPNASELELKEHVQLHLVEAMKECAEYPHGPKVMAGVLRGLTSDIDSAPTLQALKAVYKVAKDHATESEQADENSISNNTRHFAESMIRYTHLRLGNPDFVIPVPQSHSGQ